ncbi:MAG: hypothetical protein A2Y66_02370 [Nitrospirae bacterium RBG_13_41_22]|nr:MAG: hypothetical protein A2Y66_02370 [Nitrospirae bacterium RBG_13_41_22]
MKKVLIITTHFAPDRHVGAKRSTKFAKFLPECGWQPVVLTKEVTCYHGIDETLNEDLPPDLPIYRVREWHPFRAGIRGKKTSLKNVGTAELDRPTTRGWISRGMGLFDSVLFYDYPWLLPAFFTGLRLLRQQKISLIFSTSPNPEAHLIALWLRIVTGRAWVADFRDPWTALHNFYKPGHLKRAVDILCEKAIVATADHITAISHILSRNLNKLQDSQKKDKVSVIYNGYDGEDFEETDHNQFRSQPFTITYLGTWGSGRSPEPFLRALGRLLVIHPTLKDRIVVNFVGEVKFDPEMQKHIEQVISEENLDGVVKMIPFLPFRKGLDLLRQGDVSLLVVSPYHSRIGCLSSKLFEYLYAGKPILALALSESEEAQIICKAGAGQVVVPDDITAISRKIEEMYRAFQSGDALCDVDFCGIKKYERRRQTYELAAIFDSLTAMRRTPKADIRPA